MGMQAELICFGPKSVLEAAPINCLDYPGDYYRNVPSDAVVAGTIAVANTSSGSGLLAEVCGIREWDLGNHRITEIPEAFPLWDDDVIGDTLAHAVWSCVRALLNCPDVVIWFRPNG